MRAGLGEGAGQRTNATRGTSMEDERAAIRGILIFLAILVALAVALVSVTMLMATAGNVPPEEAWVRIVAQAMPRPYWLY